MPDNKRDWVQILVAPLLIGLIGVALTAWFNEQQNQRQTAIEERQAESERKLEAQRAQDAALQAYLDQMSSLLLNKDRPLRQTEEGDEVRTLAQARTSTVIQRLDADRNRTVIRFLTEAGLTGDGQSSIAILAGADLQGAHLEGVDLSTTDLSGAILDDANLSGANLINALLNNATLWDAILDHAKLSGADLRGATLRDAALRDADQNGIFEDDFSDKCNGWYRAIGPEADPFVIDYASGGLRMYNPPPDNNVFTTNATAGSAIEDAIVEVEATVTGKAPESKDHFGASYAARLATAPGTR
jgi:uncharacterized protein YjbI with pentapeptide repeats